MEDARCAVLELQLRGVDVFGIEMDPGDARSNAAIPDRIGQNL